MCVNQGVYLWQDLGFVYNIELWNWYSQLDRDLIKALNRTPHQERKEEAVWL